VLLLSRGQGPPHTTKDTPCKVCGGYLRDPTIKVNADTHTTNPTCRAAESMASKALVVAQNGGPKALGGLHHPPCRVKWWLWASLPHLTSLPRRRRRRSSPWMTSRYSNGLLYFESICDSI